MRISRRKPAGRTPAEETLAGIRLLLAPELRCADCERAGQCREHYPMLLDLHDLVPESTRAQIDALLRLP